jgi:formiminotetrahydrofolate cyclodeaminase
MSLWQLAGSELRDRTASGEPTPGGGSVACVCATLAVGLMIMALEITLKGASEDDAVQARSALHSARELLERLSRHADHDVAAFRSYMSALALPKASAAEKAAREEAKQHAAIEAARAPLAAADDMLAALRQCVAAAALTKPHVKSDVLAGADLLHGAIEAALRTVDSNLPHINDRDAAQTLTRRRVSTADSAQDVYSRLVAKSSGQSA